MPRCYMVRKGALLPDIEPPPCSPTEASVAPPDQNQVKTELSHDEGAAAEYAELRSALISERSAADTEAAHELLSLAAGVPPLPPATVLTVLHPPEPLPVYTYALQPTTIYIMQDEPPEPMYQNVRMPMPLAPGVPQKLPMLIPKPTTKVVWCKKYTLEPNGSVLVNGIPAPNYNMKETIVRKLVPMDEEIDYSDDSPYLRYYPYSELPPMPPLQYNPPRPVIEKESESGTLTTLTIEECSTDSEPELLSMQVPVIEPVPQPQIQQIQIDQLEKMVPPQPASEPDGDSDEEVLTIVTVKEKQTKYDCNECGKSYATSSNLSRHKQTHRSLDSNSAKKCGECGKVYVSMPALAMHVLTHRMGHVCGVCGKLFSRPWLLRGHLRSHTGEKPYNCEACGKAFADRSNLRAHLQTHSSDKKYECARCKKNFALKSYLNKHQEAACTRSDEDGAAA